MRPFLLLYPPDLTDPADYLTRCLRQRRLPTTQQKKRAAAFVQLRLDPTLPTPDEFTISSTPAAHQQNPRTITLTSNTLPGLYAAIGTWIRTHAQPINHASAPQTPSRSIYFATHFDIIYVSQSLPQWRRHLQDLMAWGMNALWIYLDFRDYHYPWSRAARNHPRERRQWNRLSALLQLARSMGLRIGLGSPINAAFRSQVTPDCQATPMPRFTGDLTKTEICPSTPKGRRLIHTNFKRFFQQFSFIDYLGFGCLDPGGCGCEKCTPWVGRTYLTLALELAQAAQAAIPNVKVLLTDTYAQPQDHAAILQILRQPKSKPIAGLMTFWDHLSRPFPVYHRPTAQKHLARISAALPTHKELWLFPDLSMTFAQRKNGHTVFDWGQTAANPLPARFCDLMKFSDRIQGVMPYSEGIFDDFNKVAILMSTWNPDVTKHQVIQAYRRAYFPTLDASLFKDIIIALEKNRAHLPQNHFALQTYPLIQQAEKQLPPRQRNSWRWRLLKERAFIDTQIVRAAQSPRARRAAEKALTQSAQRLRTIYREPKKRFPPIDGPSIIYRLLDFAPPTGQQGEGVI